MSEETLDVFNTRATIRPDLTQSTSGNAALDALRALGDRSSGLILGDTLGKGGMGLVRLGEQRSVGREVAIKTLKPGLDNEQAALSLLREGWVTGRLEHPNVVPVYDVGIDAAGQPFLVLKRIDGDVWTGLLREPEAVRETHDAQDVLEWHLRVLLSVTQAIRFAHDRGIVHRDLKPDNIMVGKFGEVYVLDWGIAAALDSDPSGRLPSKNTLCGTPAYMAPEMFDRAHADPQMDVYLLGGLLHEVLVGEAPHDGSTLSDAEADSRREVGVDRLDEPELSTLCAEALHPDPTARPEGAEAFARRLRDALDHRDSGRLAAQAATRAAALRTTEDAAQRRRLFAEARFAWQQALERWPENPQARQGLAEAAEEMVAWELDQGELSAAAALVREHPALRPELIERVRTAEDEHNALQAHLHALGRDQDESIGQRTRTFVAAVLGVAFIGMPLVIWTQEHRLVGYSGGVLGLGWSVAMLVSIGSLLFWARDSLSKTIVNRSFAKLMLAVPLGQLFLALVAIQNGTSLHALGHDHMIYWSAMCAATAAVVDARMLVPTLFYAVSWAVCGDRPEWTFPVIAAGDAVLCATLLAMWLPGLTLRRPPESPSE
ncbi:MAG: protein kinase [Proteobacteria bacterium]|nr:protein kinase [Pseudomonadota bacterium]